MAEVTADTVAKHAHSGPPHKACAACDHPWGRHYTRFDGTLGCSDLEADWHTDSAGDEYGVDVPCTCTGYRE